MLSETADDRPVVLHCCERFVEVTENWIYQQVVGSRRYRPVVATEQRVNAEAFPFETVVYPDVARLDYRLLCVPVRRNRLSVPLQTLSRAYERPVRALRPALLHAHFGTQAVHMMRLRRRLGVPLVTTFYGYDAGSIPKLPGWPQWYARLFARGDRFLVEGTAFRKRLIELGCPPEKVKVQHLGVDLTTIPFRPRIAASGERVLVLMAASFREKKGHEYALRAFAEARRRFLEAGGAVELRLIGDGELRSRIEGLIRELELGDSVRLLGAQPHDAFLEEALRCHLFLSPSVTATDGDTEGGAPVGLIEASATGMPVVASQHADIPEVVRHGETGWLAPERDVATLAAHLTALLQRPETWPPIGERGRRHIGAEYDLSSQAERLDAIYDELRREGSVECPLEAGEPRLNRAAETGGQTRGETRRTMRE
jgi:colanic acid/amylovoran/stewartan biosynthesis glycosyltransferase WcaL/AmsK/CpsK